MGWMECLIRLFWLCSNIWHLQGTISNFPTIPHTLAVMHYEKSKMLAFKYLQLLSIKQWGGHLHMAYLFVTVRKVYDTGSLCLFSYTFWPVLFFSQEEQSTNSKKILQLLWYIYSSWWASTSIFHLYFHPCLVPFPILNNCYFYFCFYNSFLFIVNVLQKNNQLFWYTYGTSFHFFPSSDMFYIIKHLVIVSTGKVNLLFIFIHFVIHFMQAIWFYIPLPVFLKIYRSYHLHFHIWLSVF